MLCAHAVRSIDLMAVHFEILEKPHLFEICVMIYIAEKVACRNAHICVIESNAIDENFGTSERNVTHSPSRHSVHIAHICLTLLKMAQVLQQF